MNSFSYILYSTVFNGLTSIITIETKLTAINDSLYVEHLYRQIGNEGKLSKMLHILLFIKLYNVGRLFSDAPTRSDPAFEDAHIRRNICEDISGSGFRFVDWNYTEPVKMNCVDPALKQSRYYNIFHQIYCRRKSQVRLKNLLHPYQYTNPFRQKEFSMIDIDFQRMKVKEYVFICLLKERLHGTIRIIPYYVSKEYNVSPERGQYYSPGRFIFWNHNPSIPYNYNEYPLLAEEPAIVYKSLSQDYNVELHYLRTRKYQQPGNHKKK